MDSKQDADDRNSLNLLFARVESEFESRRLWKLNGVEQLNLLTARTTEANVELGCSSQEQGVIHCFRPIWAIAPAGTKQGRFTGLTAPPGSGPQVAGRGLFPNKFLGPADSNLPAPRPSELPTFGFFDHHWLEQKAVPEDSTAVSRFSFLLHSSIVRRD